MLHSVGRIRKNGQDTTSYLGRASPPRGPAGAGRTAAVMPLPFPSLSRASLQPPKPEPFGKASRVWLQLAVLPLHLTTLGLLLQMSLKRWFFSTNFSSSHTNQWTSFHEGTVFGSNLDFFDLDFNLGSLT